MIHVKLAGVFAATARLTHPHRFHGPDFPIIVAVVSAVGLLAMIARPIWTGTVPVYDDFGVFHLPLRYFLADCLRSGRAFDWMPGMHTGFYLTGEGEAGPYHPFHWVLYLTLPLATAFACEAPAYFLAMFAGMVVFLRPHTGTVGAIVGAVAFTFSANCLAHAPHLNYIAVLAHLPWLLWLIDVAAARPGRLWPVAGIALLTGSQVLFGQPQAVSYSVLAEALYTVSVLAVTPGRVVLAVRTIVGKLLGLAVGGVQLVATLDFLKSSNRSGFDPMFGSMDPVLLIQTVAPHTLTTRLPEWQTEPLYFGLLAAVLAAFAVAMQVRASRNRATDDGNGRLVLFAVGLGILAVWLATGSHGGLYALQTKLPLVGQFRAPFRYVLLAGFAAAVLAAVGYARLARCCREGVSVSTLRLVPIWAVAGLAVAAGVWFTASYPDSGWPKFRESFLGGATIAVVAAGLLTLAARGRQFALPLLIAGVATDAVVYNFRTPPQGTAAWKDTLPLPEYVASLERPPGESGPVRALSLRWAGAGILLHGDTLVNGYRGGLEPRKELDYRTVNALRASGANWFRQPTFEPPMDIPGLKKVDPLWSRVPDPMPRTRVVTDAVVSDDPAADIGTVDVSRTALADRSLGLTDGPPGTVEVLTDDPGSIRVRTEGSGRRLLILTESWHAGWVATVDGREVETVPVYGDFLGCVVGPGVADVRFEFRPASLWYGRWLSAFGLLTVGLILAVDVSRRVRKCTTDGART